MRHISKSIVLFALAVALVAITAPAQDLEPTLTRAAARVAERLVDQHPGYGDGVEALATVPLGAADGEVDRAIREALAERGFRVAPDSKAADPGVLSLRLKVLSGTSDPVLVVEGAGPLASSEQPLRIACAFGDAAWADELDEDALFVAGPLRGDPEAAVEAVRSLARRRASSRLDIGWPVTDDVDILSHLSHRTFVGSVDRDGARLHRAYMRVDLTLGAVDRLNDVSDEAARHRAAVPLIKLAGLTILAATFLVLYLRFDLRTNGYMTHRLRLLFGTLFVLGAGFFWRLPL